MLPQPKITREEVVADQEFTAMMLLKGQKGGNCMRIMILNGSPKRDASDTMHMTRAFLEGINETGENAVHTIHVIDKHIEQADFSHLKYVMICGCGFPNSRHNFEPAVQQFKLCFPNHHTIITVPESPMFNVPEAESVTKPRLSLLRQAGHQYAEIEKIEPKLLEQIGTPMIPEDIYAKIANGEGKQ